MTYKEVYKEAQKGMKQWKKIPGVVPFEPHILETFELYFEELKKPPKRKPKIRVRFA
jgi:hypothetical protein